VTLPSVLVVGGGIGGLTAAVALRKLGFDVRVVEQSVVLGSVGAGVTLQCNGRAVLDALGIELEPADACAVGSFRALTQRGRVLMDADSGELELGHPAVSVHRTALLAALVQALEAAGGGLELGRKVMVLRNNDDGVDAIFEDGETDRFDVVLGADGINSTARRCLFGSTGTRYSGQTGWRFAETGLSGALEGTVERWAPGRRVGLVPLSDGRVYGYLIRSAPAGTASAETSTLAHVRGIFGGMDAQLDSLFDAFAVRAAAGDPPTFHHEDLRDQPKLSFGRGRLVLLGDAAHAMTPNLGQGASQAIEDAAAVAIALASGGVPPERLADHIDGIRRDRVAALQKRAWRLGLLTQWVHPVAVWLRDTAMGGMPRRAAVRQARTVFTPGLELADTLGPIVQYRGG